MTTPRTAAARARRTGVLVAVLVGLLGIVLPSGVAADEVRPVHTILGRGYAAVFGYPIDEVPSAGEEEEEHEDPPPDQTCPEDQRGVAEATAARLDALADPAGRDPVAATVESSTPTPRGQPIRFLFGLADGSLRSDPGVHGIAAGFYVDLGGAQDPWTSVETDGYVSGHARRQERCGNLFAGEAGTADQVHVISESIPGPYTFDYAHLRRTTLPGIGTFETSVTRVEMEGRTTPATARVISRVEGIQLFGEVAVDAVTSVIDYRTDGTPEGTVLHTWTIAEGVTVGGETVELEAGAAPVTEDQVVLGLAEPQVRQRDDRTIEVEAGGLYVGGDADNPLGLQAKQGVALGGARMTATAFQRVVSSTTRSASAGGDVGGGGTTSPPQTAPPPTPSALPRSSAVPATPAEAPAAAPSPDVASPVALEPVTTVRRYGVYVTAPQSAGVAGVAGLTAVALLAVLAAWLRHRSWRFRVLLGAPGLRLLDRAYRAFCRG